MKKRNRDEIIEILRQVDRSLDTQPSIKAACENMGINRSSYYRWQKRIAMEHAPMLRTRRRNSGNQGLSDKVAALEQAARGNLRALLNGAISSSFCKTETDGVSEERVGR